MGPKFVDGGLLDNVPADEVKKLGGLFMIRLNALTTSNNNTNMLDSRTCPFDKTRMPRIANAK